MFSSLTRNTINKFPLPPVTQLNYSIARTMITSHAVMIKQHGEPQDVLFTQKYDIDDDNLAADSVIVKVLGAPINPSDLNQVQGVYPSQPEKTTKFGTSFPSFVGGNEGLFEVVKVGDNVKNLKPGDWTLPLSVNLGTWRTFAELKSDEVFKIPSPEESKAKGVSPLTVNEGATLSVNPLSAYFMLTANKDITLNKNDWFIQNGGNSAVGKYASQMAKLMGINSISVIRDRPNLEEVKKELKEQCGATHVITEEESGSREFGATIKSWIKESGGSLKLAINCVGGKSAANIARKVDDSGLMLTYGGMSLQPVTFPTTLHIFKNFTSKGFWVTRLLKEHPELKEETVNKIINWYQTDQLSAAPSEENKYEGGDLAEVFMKGIANSKNGKQLVTF